MSESAPAKKQQPLLPCKSLVCQHQMHLLSVLLGRTYIKDAARWYQCIALQVYGPLYKSLCALPIRKLL